MLKFQPKESFSALPRSPHPAEFLPGRRRTMPSKRTPGPRTATRVAVFLAAFLLFTLSEYAFRPQIAPFVNGAMTVRPAARLVDWVAPSEHVRARGDRIQSRLAYIRVAQGCEGIDVMLMFVAAMLGASMGWRRRALGCAVGVGVIYVSNLMRVAGLWFCVRYWPARFEAMHVIVGQTVIIVLAILLFAGWTGAAPTRRSAEVRAT
jgi:exosortase family protein XrtM